jgi:hypothetical protein
MRFLLYFAGGLVLSLAWLTVAHMLGVADWDRGWWAGALSSAPFSIATIWRLVAEPRK